MCRGTTHPLAHEHALPNAVRKPQRTSAHAHARARPKPSHPKVAKNKPYTPTPTHPHHTRTHKFTHAHARARPRKPRPTRVCMGAQGRAGVGRGEQGHNTPSTEVGRGD